MAPSDAATTRAWGGVAGSAQEPTDVFRAAGRVELRDVLAAVQEVPGPERRQQGLVQLAEWQRGMLPPHTQPLPLPVEAGSPPHRRDPGPAEASPPVKGHWQQILREFILNDEQFRGQVLLSAHKFLKGGGCTNLSYALSTLTDMSWSVMVLVWEAWQDGRLAAVFDAEKNDAGYKKRYLELSQQFKDCRAAWLEEISGFRDHKRARIWDASLQAAYDAAFQHDVFEFVPEAALAQEHRPYFKQALQECVKMALTAGADERMRLLLEKIARLEAELAASLAEIARLQEEFKEERRREYYKKPLRKEVPVAEPKPETCEAEVQTDVWEPEPVIKEVEVERQDTGELEAERERNAWLEEEILRLQGLLKERDGEIADLKRVRMDLEAALERAAASAAQELERERERERERAELLEELKRLRELLAKAESLNESLRAQLAEGLLQPEREPKAVQVDLPPVTLAAPPPPSRPPMQEEAAQTTERWPSPPPKRDRGLQVELASGPSEEEERLRQLLAALRGELEQERERLRQLEQELATERQGSRGAEEARRLLQLEREKSRRLQEALQALRNLVEDLKHRLEELGADVSDVDAVLQDDFLQTVTKPLSRVFDRLWTDAQEKNRKKKEREAEAFISDPGFSEALLRLRKQNNSSTNVSAGSWLFADPAWDAICPCCSRPCLASMLPPGSHQPSIADVKVQTWAGPGLGPGPGPGLGTGPGPGLGPGAGHGTGAAPSQGRLRSGAAGSPRLRSGEAGSHSSAQSQSQTQTLLSTMSLLGTQADIGRISSLPVPSDLTVKSMPTLDDAAAACGPAQLSGPGSGPLEEVGTWPEGRDPGGEASLDEAGRKVRAGGIPSAVEARAAALSGHGLSFTEHCRRMRVEGTPVPDLDVSVKTHSRSMQLSHLLTHQKKPVACQEDSAETEGRSGAPWEVPANLLLSTIPAVRPSTSISAAAPRRPAASLAPLQSQKATTAAATSAPGAAAGRNGKLRGQGQWLAQPHQTQTPQEQPPECGSPKVNASRASVPGAATFPRSKSAPQSGSQPMAASVQVELQRRSNLPTTSVAPLQPDRCSLRGCGAAVPPSALKKEK